MKDYLNLMKEYASLSSWAIWESKNNEKFEKEADMEVNIDFNKYKDKLQKSNYVVLGLNPGNYKDIPKETFFSRKEKLDLKDWNNFHNVGRSRDYLLAEAIRGTVVEGSYMTDLLSIYCSDSSKISSIVKNNKDKVIESIIEFDESMSKLIDKSDTIILICLGTKTYNYASRFLVKNELNVNLKKKYLAYKFHHYSGANRHVSSNCEKDNYYPKIFKETLINIE